MMGGLLEEVMVNQSLKDHSFNRCLVHTCLGTVLYSPGWWRRPVWRKGWVFCRSLECECAWYKLRVWDSGITVAEGWE